MVDAIDFGSLYIILIILKLPRNSSKEMKMSEVIGVVILLLKPLLLEVRKKGRQPTYRYTDGTSR